MSREGHTIGLLFSQDADRRLLVAVAQELGYQPLAPELKEAHPEEWTDVSLVIADEAAARLLKEGLLALKRRTAAAFQHIPILIALPREDDPTSWLEEGFDDVLHLTTSKSALRARLQVWLRLREELTEQAQLERGLAAVHALGRKLILSQDEAGIAQATVEAAHKVLGLEDCGLFLVDEPAQRLVLRAHTLGDGVPGPKELPLASEQGIMVAVARSGEPIYVPDTSRDPRYVSGALPNRSELCVPLRAGEKVLGVLNAESQKLDAFSPTDRKLLEALADVAAIALENARLFKEIRRLKEFNEDIVQNVSEGIISEDAEGVLTFVNPAAAKMLGYRPEELIGRHWTVIVPPDQRSTVQAADERRKRGETDRYLLKLTRKDGTQLSVLVSGIPLFEGDCFTGTLAVLTDITEQIRAQEQLQQSHARLERLLEETVNVLASTVEIRDPYTAGHQRRVTRLACAIAAELGLPEERITGLRVAALVHDIGKIAIPTAILSKARKLTKEESDLIKTHPRISYGILKKIKFPWPVAEIVLQHHERLDGSGYPQGLKGDEIRLEARILAVADAVEAMISHRPYRPACSLDEALEEISRHKGTLYDPEVVEACLRLFKRGFTLEEA